MVFCHTLQYIAPDGNTDGNTCVSASPVAVSVTLHKRLVVVTVIDAKYPCSDRFGLRQSRLIRSIAY